MLLCGCSPIASNAKILTLAQLDAVGRTPYRIQEGDTLSIKFVNVPELNDSVLVRPDGRISLAYLPDVQAANLTIPELRQSLVKTYEPVLKAPNLTVALTASTSTRVFVGGEVAAPGEFDFPGRGTLSQYLTRAGGLKVSANATQVLVIRRGEDFKPVIGVVRVADILSGADLANDITLRPNDVIYVPKTPITRVDEITDQYVKQIVPFNFNFSYALP